MSPSRSEAVPQVTPESRQVNDRLRVREELEAFYVVLDHDDTDWIVAFDKATEFAAREWATNMVESYNERYDDPRVDLLKQHAPPPAR